MVMRLIDNTSTVQKDLFQWVGQAHATSARQRTERQPRQREDESPSSRDSYEHTAGEDEPPADFEETLHALGVAAAASHEAHGQLALPGMEEAADLSISAPGDPRGRRLDLEA